MPLLNTTNIYFTFYVRIEWSTFDIAPPCSSHSTQTQPCPLLIGYPQGTPLLIGCLQRAPPPATRTTSNRARADKTCAKYGSVHAGEWTGVLRNLATLTSTHPRGEGYFGHTERKTTPYHMTNVIWNTNKMRKILRWGILPMKTVKCRAVWSRVDE